ncbi:MAG TPA: 3-deoxy-D-manno-octulosonic acid kinase [Steroidobacteraceae bacterium]|nr:3-deoxy-D-manno-octulosonic acid kinase [Steroidobacteraceae bacterium]
MQLARIPTATGAILYDPSRIDHPAAADFEPDALGHAGRIDGTARGRGSVWFVAARGGTGGWVLRRYRRGGLVARLVEDVYVWRGEAATRPFRELSLLAELEQRQLPAVRPVAARYLRTGWGYRADLLTVAIPGARSLAALLAEDLALGVWREVGRTIRVLHAAGVCHADLNAHNVLIDGAGLVTLVDFDRGSLRAAGTWERRNLARLTRSLAKLSAGEPRRFTHAQAAALLEGYEAARSAPRR